MISSTLIFLILNTVAVLMFMSFFLEYYIARYDLSEAQVASIMKKLPESLESYLFIRGGSFEKLVKNASIPLPLSMMAFIMVIPITTIGNIYIELVNDQLLLVVIYIFILIGCACAVFKFLGIVRDAISSDAQ